MQGSFKMHRSAWRSGTLESLVTLQRGFDITKKEQEPGPYQVISSSGAASTHSAYMVQGPGVVIGRKGTLGTVFYSERPFWPHDTTLWVKDFHGNDPHFCYYFLKTMGLEHYDCGASNPTLNRNHIHSLPIEYPRLPVQRRIASILSAYDNLIENNARRIKILEEMAQMIFREWFLNFRFPGHERVKMIESVLGPIPISCRVVELGDVIEFENGKAAANIADGALPLYGSNGVIGRVSVPRYENAVIIGRVGAYCGSTMYCRTAFWASDNTIVAKPVSEESLCVEAAYHVLRELNLRRYAGGSAQPLLTQNVLRRLQTVLPDEATNQKTREVLQPLHGLIIALESKNINLRITRDLLLPKLISGEIPAEATDEAAAELVAQPA